MHIMISLKTHILFRKVSIFCLWKLGYTYSLEELLMKRDQLCEFIKSFYYNKTIYIIKGKTMTNLFFAINKADKLIFFVKKLQLS